MLKIGIMSSALEYCLQLKFGIFFLIHLGLKIGFQLPILPTTSRNQLSAEDELKYNMWHKNKFAELSWYSEFFVCIEKKKKYQTVIASEISIIS